jgi:hypothetical protein
MSDGQLFDWLVSKEGGWALDAADLIAVRGLTDDPSK